MVSFVVTAVVIGAAVVGPAVVAGSSLPVTVMKSCCVEALFFAKDFPLISIIVREYYHDKSCVKFSRQQNSN